ncbi:MAG: TonB-dependent receptor [Burkholderiales bacterium]
MLITAGSNAARTLASLLCAFAWTSATAQTSAAADEQTAPDVSDLDAIVVTASKRSENIQDVPISVTVIDSTSLLERGASDYRDYLTSIAGVSLVDFGTNTNRVIIRGLATASDTQAGGNTAITYFDEIALGDTVVGSIEVEPLDLERIEVLRGPQGTLYGAGSIGGTLRFIPNRPDPDGFSGFANVSTAAIDEAHGVEYSGQAGVNIPLGTGAAIRIAGYHSGDPDFIRNLRDGSDVGGVRKYGAQISTLVELGADTEVVARYVYNHGRVNGATLAQLDRPGYFVDTLDESFERDTHIFTGTLTHDFSRSTLTSATGYIDQETSFEDDATNIICQTIICGSPPPFQSLVQSTVGQSIFSQEVRLASNGEGNTLDWIVGAFYQRTKGSTVNDLVTFPAGPPTVLNDLHPELEQLAGFAELNWHFADRWTLAGGGRFADYELVSDDLLLGSRSTAKDTTFNPKVNLEVETDGGQLYYAQASKGFRPGGVNRLSPQPGCHPQISPHFDSDGLWSYEIGAKLGLPGNIGTLNMSAYHSDWTDIPIVINALGGTATNGDLCNPIPYSENLGKAEVRGVEAELVLRPTDGLTLDTYRHPVGHCRQVIWTASPIELDSVAK